jgi:hypothetical protein
MTEKNPLWVAKPHGHNVQMMLDAYSAWTDESKGSDIDEIKRAMNLGLNYSTEAPVSP